MSDLQWALILLGAALVVAVWLYNRWQMRAFEARRRARARTEAPTQASAPGAVAVTERQEPALGIPPAETGTGSSAAPAPTAAAASPAARPPAQTSDFLEPDLPLEPETAALPAGSSVDLPLDIEEESAAPPPPVPLPAEWADGVVDCLARIDFSRPVAAATLWAARRDFGAALDKPMQWLALDETNAQWRTLPADLPGAVSQLAVALQCVDRAGAVSEETLRRFAAGIEALAGRFGGRATLPDLAAQLERARELDAFCASVDLQLTLHVLPNAASTMPGAALAPLLSRYGLAAEGDRFVAHDEAGHEVFALLCRTATATPLTDVAALALTDLVFALDVPRVVDGAQAFARMIDCARQCAAALGGFVADAHRKPLPEALEATIRGRIEELQKRMQARGIAPGSVRALRLFA